MIEAMLDQNFQLPHRANEILGDLTNLAVELGSAEGLECLKLASVAIDSACVNSMPALERFLDDYCATLLFPFELPAVAQAYHCTARSQVRELIALDRQFTGIRRLTAFASASARVGQAQLKRLRPLRSERVVQRFLKSVEAGEARGWHTLVFGLVLALYSLPLRQGLSHFAYQTIGGFVHAAGQRISIDDSARQRLLSACEPGIAKAIETVVAGARPQLLESTRA